MDKLDKQTLYSTPKSYNEIEDFIMRMDPKSRNEAFVVSGMTWNLVIEKLMTEKPISDQARLKYDDTYWDVYYKWRGKDAGTIDEVEITGVYIEGNAADLMELLSDETIDDMVIMIENDEVIYEHEII